LPIDVTIVALVSISIPRHSLPPGVAIIVPVGGVAQTPILDVVERVHRANLGVVAHMLPLDVVE
jgi:hypothetical protein